MSGLYNTYMFKIAVNEEASPLIDTIRAYISGIPYNRGGQVLTWNCIGVCRTGCTFKTRSPYNDDITALHAKCLLNQCISLIGPTLNGFRVEVTFIISAVKIEGLLVSEDGVTSEACSQRCCRPLRRPANETVAPAQDPFTVPLQYIAPTSCDNA